jgi:nucleoside-diphosphate-sugar epimerase
MMRYSNKKSALSLIFKYFQMKISILSCGWLGLPLGEFLVYEGHLVKGATTKNEKLINLKNAGISPFLLNLNPNLTCVNFSELIDSEVIIINIPPKVAKNGNDFHFLQITNLIEGIITNFDQKIAPKIIFVSSTSVYPDANQIATESSEVDQNSVLVKVEKLVKSSFENVTILRFGGLMGYERCTGKYYAGKPFDNWASGVNYIHRDDAILLITNIIENNIWNETLNCVSPVHPSRKEIITKNCTELGLELPVFSEKPSNENFKIISPEKLLSITNFKFKYSNPLDFYYSK